MSKKAHALNVPHQTTFEAMYIGASQAITIGASSAQSSATQGGTTCVQLCSTVACFVAIGPNPTAAANTSCYLPANSPIKMACNPGDKVAVIQASAGGTLYMTEGA